MQDWPHHLRGFFANVSPADGAPIRVDRLGHRVTQHGVNRSSGRLWLFLVAGGERASHGAMGKVSAKPEQKSTNLT
jgi:hypothetical protein